LGRVICGLGETHKAQCLREIDASRKFYEEIAKKNTNDKTKVWKGSAKWFYDKVCHVVDRANAIKNEQTQKPEKLIDVKMTFQGNMGTALCVVTQTGTTKCYSAKNSGRMDDQTNTTPLFNTNLAPNGKLIEQTSCRTSHVDAAGSPTGCTSCPKGMHHTILNPRRSTGTCTENFCPFCKPSSCCGPHHKHFVINTESFEGVCVRHTNDCTPLCMPRDTTPDFKGVTVCSKGCNQLRKFATKPPAGKTKEESAESDLSSLVVCQSDKRVTCDPKKPNALGHICQVQKSITASAICKFDSDLWNLGGTCLSNHVHALKTKICPPASSEVITRIQKMCRKPKACGKKSCSKEAKSEGALCSPLALTY